MLKGIYEPGRPEDTATKDEYEQALPGQSNTQYTLAVSAFADVVCSANNNVIISETDSIKEFNFEGVSSQGRKCD